MAFHMSTNVPSMMHLISGPAMGMKLTAIEIPLMIHCFRPESMLSQASLMAVMAWALAQVVLMSPQASTRPEAAPFILLISGVTVSDSTW